MYLVIPKSEIFTILVELTKQFLAAYKRRREPEFEFKFCFRVSTLIFLRLLGPQPTSLCEQPVIFMVAPVGGVYDLAYLPSRGRF